MIGYHYTTLENWHHIERNGLHPQPINHPDLARSPFANHIKEGIWVFRQQQFGLSLLAALVQRVLTHKSLAVCCIRARFEPDWVARPLDWKPGERLEVLHNGVFDVTVGGSEVVTQSSYHEREPLLIVTHPIPKSRLHPIQIWDFGEFLKDGAVDAPRSTL